MTPGYISADPLQPTYSFQLPALTGGSYLVEVYAQTTDRVALQNDISATPTLASQENLSRSSGSTTISQTFTIPGPTSQLPIAIGLSVTPVNGGGATVNWSLVPGANSYYVNVWTCAGSAAPNLACSTGGTYQEIAGNWVNATSAIIPTGTLTPGVAYDVYVTACQQDMTDTTTVPPADPGTQVDMSDTTFTYATFTAQ